MRVNVHKTQIVAASMPVNVSDTDRVILFRKVVTNDFIDEMVIGEFSEASDHAATIVLVPVKTVANWLAKQIKLISSDVEKFTRTGLTEDALMICISSLNYHVEALTEVLSHMQSKNPAQTFLLSSDTL